MKVLIGLIAGALLTIGVLVSVQTVRAGTSFDDVAAELMCQCGCGLTLTACNMPECTVRVQMADQVRDLIGKGQSKDQVIGYFVNTYGEVALSAPTKQGFNLLAWLGPFAAIAVGGGFVYLAVDQWVLRRGQRSRAEGVVEDEVVAPADLSRYEKRLRKELEDNDEGGA